MICNAPLWKILIVNGIMITISVGIVYLFHRFWGKK